jgi:hemolysin III
MENTTNDANYHRYEIKNEVWNAITHGLAIGRAVAGLIALLLRASDIWQIVSFSIYGATLILLFLISTLRHSLHFTPAGQIFHVLDHSSIYLLIAGSYTPYTLVTLRPGWLGWTVFGIIWLCAIVGISVSSVFLSRTSQVPRLSTILYVVMGWMILLAIYPLYQKLSANGHLGFWLLVIGGVIYSVGALIYRKKFPYAHVVWHVFVMVAALLMWLSIYGFVGR